VMDVISPDFPVEGIKLVVMKRDSSA